jgi:hypothetical protein
MNLLERYLQAIDWALPRGKADDILAELRDVLTMRMEDREEALGRPITGLEHRRASHPSGGDRHWLSLEQPKGRGASAHHDRLRRFAP